MLHRIVGPEFDLTHQGHYTAIVRRATVQVIEAPSLKGPLSPLPAHFYRIAQHLKVQIKDSAEMPIDVWNCYSPSSKVHRHTATVCANTSYSILQLIQAREHSLPAI